MPQRKTGIGSAPPRTKEELFTWSKEGWQHYREKVLKEKEGKKWTSNPKPESDYLSRSS